MKAYVYNWCSHFSDQEWTYVIVFAADRAAADMFVREVDQDLLTLLDDQKLAASKHLVVTEKDIKPGVFHRIMASE